MCSRNFRLNTPDYSTSYWSVFKKYNLGECLGKIRKQMGAVTVVIQGEIIGPKIQKNKYKRSEYELYVFNLIVDGKLCCDSVMRDVCSRYGLNAVPLIGEYTLMDTIQGMVHVSESTSSIESGVIQEGIVCRNYERGVKFVFTEKLDGQSGTFFISKNKNKLLSFFGNHDIGVCVLVILD